jgi:Tfp pilus assembly protein PilV
VVCHEFGSRRRGSLAVEAAMAVALLGSAMFAMARFSQNSAALERQADERLAAELAAENLLERLRDVPASEIANAARIAAAELERQSGCPLQVTADGVSGADQPAAVHLRVAAGPPDRWQITLHDWIFETGGPRLSDAPQEESDDERSKP